MKKFGKYIFPIIALLIPFVLYLNTLLPGVDFWDTGEFQTIAYTFDIAHPTGYPTYILLGKIFLLVFPFGSVAWKMNLLSAIYVSLGSLLIFLTIRKITKKTILSLLISTLLSINPFVWNIAIKADPHSLHFLFTSLFIYLSYVRLLPLLGLVTGLAIGNQMMSIFFVPSLIIILLVALKEKVPLITIIKSVFMFILGTSVYLLLPIISLFKIPLTADYQINTWKNFIRYIFGQDFGGSMFHWSKNNFQQTLIYYFSLLQKALPSFIWILIPIGFISGFILRPIFNISLFSIYLTTLFFAMTYQNAAIERYYIPQFTILTIWISFSIRQILNLTQTKIASFLMYLIIAISIIIMVLGNYTKIDQSNNTSASKWTEETLNSIENNAVFFSWWSYSTPLWYAQMVEGNRPDLIIVNASEWQWEKMAEKYIDYKPVYFLEKINLDNSNLELIKSGNVYKLIYSKNHF